MRSTPAVNLSKILNPNGWVAASHRQIAMKTTATNPEIFESTYALLLRSEEKQRSRFENLIYTVLAVSTIFAVLTFGCEAAMMHSSIAYMSRCDYDLSLPFA